MLISDKFILGLDQNRVNYKKIGNTFLTGTITALLVFLFIFGVFCPVANAGAIPTVTWDVGNSGTHFLSDGAVGQIPNTITVVEPTINNTGIDTINVTISSTSDPVGVPLTLTETGNLTHIFTNTNLIFLRNNTGHGVGITLPNDILIPNDSTTSITIFDTGTNADPFAVDVLPMLIISDTDMIGISPNFNETGNNTSQFSGQIQFKSSSSGSSGNLLNVTNGDEVSIVDLNTSIVTNSLILPNTNPGINAISAGEGDTVTATYAGISESISIGCEPPACGGGGGGGGLISPGLVLDILAGIGGSPYIVSPPSFGGTYYHYSDGLTFTQGTNMSILDTSKYNQELPKQVMMSGVPVSMTFKTFEAYNPTAVVHMGLYIIPRGQDMITSNSIGSIVWEKGKPVEVNNPNKILSDTAASSTDDGKFQYTKFSFTPEKSYDTMSFLVRAWNDHLYSTDIRVHDDIVTSPILKTLPEGVVRYDNFDNLQTTLEKDKFYRPQIMAHIHSTTDVFSSTDAGHLYWLYDTINHTVTLVMEDKNDNALYSYKGTLDPIVPDKKGDYGFMQFTVKQLNRQDEQQEKQAMKIEEDKALAMALENGLIVHYNW